MKKTKITITDFFIILIIILNLLDFLNYATPELSLLQKMISWSAMIYLLYSMGFTRILIGYKEKFIDIMLLVSYLLIVLKDIIYYIIHTDFYYLEFLKIVQIYQAEIKFFSFSISAMIIIFLSFYISRKTKIEKKSLLGAFDIEKRSHKIKFLITLLAISFIAYFIFMLAFGWFTIVIDAPILMIGAVYYFFAAKKIHKSESAVMRISDFGDKMIERFINFFHKKETFSLGLISLLILHFFTDIFVFVLPSLISLKDTLYSAAISENTKTIFELFLLNINGADAYTILNVSIIYLINIIFIASIFIIPIFLFKSIYEKKELVLQRVVNFLIIVSLPIYLLFPIYRISKIENISSGISGVNISLEIIKITESVQYVLPICLFIFLLCLVIYRLKNELLKKISLVLIFIPITNYAISYFESTVYYYIILIRQIMSFKNILIIPFMLIFLLLIVFFYIGSLLLFIYETLKLNFMEYLPKTTDIDALKKLLTFIIFFASIYLGMYYISAVMTIFKAKAIDFIMPILLAFVLIILPSVNLFFIRPVYFRNIKNLLLTPLALLLGAILGFSFIYFKEPLGYLSDNLLIIIIYLAFVAISEEMLFRHYLLEYSKNTFGFKKALALQSIIFAMMHLSKGISVDIFILLIIFAVIAGIIKEKTGLFNAMAFHFTANIILYTHLIM